MATPEVFARRMLGYATSVLLEGADLLRRVGSAAGRNVVYRTPVDTGLARSNWVASVGGPDLSERGIRSARETANEIAAVLSAIKADSELHIANGGEKVPYLKYLNAGTSFQAPANFVRIALMDARAKVLANPRLLVLRRKL